MLSSCDSDESITSPENSDPVITDKGTPTGEISSLSIGSSGGSLESADGRLSVIIPSGALSSNTTISIQPITNEGPLGLGSGYRLQPEGATFAKPVTLKFHYDEQLLNETPEDFLWIVTQTSSLTWNAMLKSTVNTAAKTVTVETTHFSDWALGRFVDLSLSPGSVTLLKGTSVQLRVEGFVRDKALSEEEELAPLIPITGDAESLTPLTTIPPVESRLMDFRVKQWTLNGSAAPVSNSNGTLEASKNNATFTAPNKKPSVNPVAVSVQLEASNKEGGKLNYFLTSNISIVDSDYYLLVNIDGVVYEYYQYGFNGTIPPDPNDTWMANCSLSSDQELAIYGIHSINNTDIKNSFAVVIDNPFEGTKSLECFTNDGNDEVEYLPAALTAGYQLDYSKRTNVNSVCNTETGCAEFSVTLLKYTGDQMSEVYGYFSGIIHEEQADYANACKSSDPHTVKGEFRMVMVK
ncbi:MAG: hypothetical protein C0490_10985 [Marivirga sp.]|nr:hypothetical protein [Marivirga sp.]